MTDRIHIVGIGGTGLSAIAKVLYERGEAVSGSDQAPSPYAQALEELGVPVTYGHAAANVAGARLVLASSAVAADNPEVLAARQAGIPVLRREEYFRELTAGYRTVAVAGTHGKSTTTAMIAWILEQARRDPSYIIGGVATDLGTNAHAGSGIEFVVEADEYDRAFLGLSPSVAVVTNIEHDHPDCYPTAVEFHAAFEAFGAQVQDLLITCADDPGAAALMPDGVRRITYGLHTPADWRATEVQPTAGGGTSFTAWHHDLRLGSVTLTQPGEHNVSNSLGALAAADHLGTPFATSVHALASFHDPALVARTLAFAMSPQVRSQDTPVMSAGRQCMYSARPFAVRFIIASSQCQSLWLAFCARQDFSSDFKPSWSPARSSFVRCCITLYGAQDFG